MNIRSLKRSVPDKTKSGQSGISNQSSGFDSFGSLTQQSNTLNFMFITKINGSSTIPTFLSSAIIFIIVLCPRHTPRSDADDATEHPHHTLHAPRQRLARDHAAEKQQDAEEEADLARSGWI